MRNSVEITRKYQFGYMLLQHLKAVGVCIVFQAVACWKFLGLTPGKYIVGTIFALVYAGMIYSGAKKLSDFDGKPYTPLKQKLKWGIFWGIMLSAAMLFFVAIHIGVWKFWSNGDGFTNVFASTLNLLFFAWIAPFFGFAQQCYGSVPLYLVAIFTFLPIIMSTLGYYAGIAKFDVLEKLDALTFEKDEDDE
ncbi:MAG: hypothetical protein J1G06_01960 [Oscillospiraceae bacterium]|nr:hypothetical protein [Oscillospiraceae bacterium]